MEGRYDDEIHESAGFKSFDDYLDSNFHDPFDESDFYNEKEFEEIKLKAFKASLKQFVLKKCFISSCEGNLILKLNKNDKSLFWGCSSFPICKSTSSILANNKTISKCEICNSNYVIDKINSYGSLSLICENEECRNTIIISVEELYVGKPFKGTIKK